MCFYFFSHYKHQISWSESETTWAIGSSLSWMSKGSVQAQWNVEEKLNVEGSLYRCKPFTDVPNPPWTSHYTLNLQLVEWKTLSCSSSNSWDIKFLIFNLTLKIDHRKDGKYLTTGIVHWEKKIRTTLKPFLCIYCHDQKLVASSRGSLKSFTLNPQDFYFRVEY